jgi:SpoVK/Ycf46/Vps4 family AAA+-type ATPase
MAHWDGLLSKSTERVLVLAATNRPFDLDEAIIRRFQRRIMVGLPNAESRERILRTLLAKEKLEEGFDFKELATMTDGYTGSDLKNLCTAAAFRPVRDFLKTEQEKEKAKKKGAEKKEEEKKEEEKKEEEKNEDRGESENSEQSSKDGAEIKEDKKEEVEETVITLRPLTMEDLKQAKNQISPSFASEGVGMNELKEWNELYGEGGSRKKQSPTYFL